MMIIRTLKLSGIEPARIFEAGDGVEGLRYLEEHPVDLMIVDLNMPLMDGKEMLEVARSDPAGRDVPALVVSTESNREEIQFVKTMSSGYVHKPFTPETLKNEILKVFPV